ncbi:unnamed protein product [Discosporangium mesarthrocarpum]
MFPPLTELVRRLKRLREISRCGGKRASAVSFVVLIYVFTWFRQRGQPQVVCRHTERNLRLIRSLAGVLDRPYLPSWLTPNGHINCFLGYAKSGPRQPTTREVVRTWDGGNFALDWRNRDEGEPELSPLAPTVLVIHGLNGHSKEGYVLYAMDRAHSRGWRAVAMNHRGCGGTRLSSGWSYNASFTGDVRLAISHIRHRHPESPIFAVGYSLGANLLVKYLGEEGAHGGAPLSGAVAVSNPWCFEENTVSLGPKSQGQGLPARLMGALYSTALATGIKRELQKHKNNEFLRRRKGLDIRGGMDAVTVSDYDQAMIIPMWGYKDVEEYHTDASSCRYVDHVRSPLLCVNAADDPICQPCLWPLEACRGNPEVIFVSTRAGGHIGWGEGINPWARPSWADTLIVEYISALLLETDGHGTQTPLHSSGPEAGVQSQEAEEWGGSVSVGKAGGLLSVSRL